MLPQELIIDEWSGSLEKSLHPIRQECDDEISKRTDWRFLLPNPRPSHVAYSGPFDATLSAALNQFRDSLTVISQRYQAAHSQDHPSAYDLFILRWRSLGGVEKAYSLLKLGGYLYWEIDRTNWLASVRGIRRLSKWEKDRGFRLFPGYVVSLERHGFSDIEPYRHLPNFEECTEIVPLNDPIALDHVFSRHRGDFTGQLKRTAGRCLVRTGLLHHLVPCISLVARKGLAPKQAV